MQRATICTICVIALIFLFSQQMTRDCTDSLFYGTISWFGCCLSALWSLYSKTQNAHSCYGGILQNFIMHLSCSNPCYMRPMATIRADGRHRTRGWSRPYARMLAVNQLRICFEIILSLAERYFGIDLRCQGAVNSGLFTSLDREKMPKRASDKPKKQILKHISDNFKTDS